MGKLTLVGFGCALTQTFGAELESWA